MTTQKIASNVTVRVNADGVDSTAHTMSFGISTKPTTKKARVGSKGVALPVEVTSTAAVKIAAVELAAGVMRESW